MSAKTTFRASYEQRYSSDAKPTLQTKEPLPHSGSAYVPSSESRRHHAEDLMLSAWVFYIARDDSQHPIEVEVHGVWLAASPSWCVARLSQAMVSP